MFPSFCQNSPRCVRVSDQAWGSEDAGGMRRCSSTSEETPPQLRIATRKKKSKTVNEGQLVRMMTSLGLQPREEIGKCPPIPGKVPESTPSVDTQTDGSSELEQCDPPASPSRMAIPEHEQVFRKQSESKTGILAEEPQSRSVIYKQGCAHLHNYKKQVSYTLRPDTLFRKIWDSLYLLFLTVETTHWLIAITTLKDSGEFSALYTDWFISCKALFSLFWAIDIYLQAKTCYLQKWEIVDNIQVIRENYIKKCFVIDVLAMIPADITCYAINEKVGIHLSSMRVLRILRVPNLFKRSSPIKEMPRWVVVVFVTFWTIQWVSLHSCIWMAIATADEQKIETKLVSDDPYSAFGWAIYFIVSVVSSVGFGDIAPSFLKTKLYITYVAIVGIIILLAGGGMAGAYFITTDPFQLLIIERRRRLEALMERCCIPWETQKEAFTVYPVILDANIKDYQSIMYDLPDFLQEKIAFHIKVDLLKSVPMFTKLSNEVLSMLAKLLLDAYAQPKEFIIASGEVGNEMFFLSNGVVEVLLPTSDGTEETWAANLTSGSYFGEIALLHETTRIASVRSLTSCVLYKLDKPDFGNLMKYSSELRDVMHYETKRRVMLTINNLGADISSQTSTSSVADDANEQNVTSKRVQAICRLIEPERLKGSQTEMSKQSPRADNVSNDGNNNNNNNANDKSRLAVPV